MELKILDQNGLNLLLGHNESVNRLLLLGQYLFFPQFGLGLLLQHLLLPLL